MALPAVPTFLFPRVQQNIVAEVLIHSLRGLLINYLLMTSGISQWHFSRDDEMFAVCRGRGGVVFGRQISQVCTHWTRCVCVCVRERRRERVEVIAEHWVQLRAFVTTLLGFEAWHLFLKMDLWPPKEWRFPFSFLDPSFLSCFSNKGLKCAET